MSKIILKYRRKEKISDKEKKTAGGEIVRNAVNKGKKRLEKAKRENEYLVKNSQLKY